MEALTEKYISSAEEVINNLKLTDAILNLTEEAITNVLNWAGNYLKDAKYYKVQGKLETSLVSVAYCEGLLDALRLIGAVNFEWSTNQEIKK